MHSRTCVEVSSNAVPCSTNFVNLRKLCKNPDVTMFRLSAGCICLWYCAWSETPYIHGWRLCTEGKRMVGWNACGTGGKGEEGGGGGGEENLRPSARVFPRSHVSRSFVSRRTFSYDDLKNCETIPLLPPQFTICEPHPAVIHFFLLYLKCKRHNLRRLHSRRNDFILFLVLRFFAFC